MNKALMMVVVGILVSVAISQNPTYSGWIRCGPEEAFSVTSVVVDPTEPQTVYAVGETSPKAGGGASWKTTDGGSTWHQLKLGVPEGGRILVDPFHPEMLYATSLGRVLRSSDAGATWTEMGRVVDASSPVRAMVMIVDPASPRTLFAGLGYQGSDTDGGVSKSTDGGTTWTPSGLSGSIVYALFASTGGRRSLFAAGSRGLHRSDDEGRTWIDVGPQAARARHMSFVVAPSDPRRILVGTSGDGIFRTADGGVTWVASSDGLSHPAVYALAMDPQRTHVVWAGTSGGGMFRSTDSGRNWSAVNDGSDALYTKSLAIATGNPTVLYASAGRVGVIKWTAELNDD